MKNILVWLVVIGFTLAGCTYLPFLDETLGTQSAPTPLIPATATQQATPVADSTPASEGPVRLTLWIPPQFDPQADTEAGRLLKKRLDAFVSRRPGLEVETRVKAIGGSGGLYESLSAASGAAQSALPDLIALPQDTLRSAAIKGLLRPMDGLTNAMDDTDWFEFARQLAHFQDKVYGLPFAVDVLGQVSRLSKVSAPPADWTAALQLPGPLAFAAADPTALYTLAQYQAAQGEITDEQERASLDANVLAEVLTFYQQAEQSGLMPYWLTQLQGDEQVWQAFQEGRADLISAWSSQFIREAPEDSAISPMTTSDGKPFSIGTGWVWALASVEPERRELAVELAGYLTESGFLADWTAAAGFLPPRPSALDAWTESEARTVLRQIAAVAVLYPPAELLSSLGPALQNATVQVLKRLSEPGAAAQEAANSLVSP